MRLSEGIELGPPFFRKREVIRLARLHEFPLGLAAVCARSTERRRRARPKKIASIATALEGHRRVSVSDRCRQNCLAI